MAGSQGSAVPASVALAQRSGGDDLQAAEGKSSSANCTSAAMTPVLLAHRAIEMRAA
jgi:hypothetical protein